MSDENVQTTNEDFELFKEEFKKWQVHFGLIGWNVFFRHEKLKNMFACIRTNLVGRVATVKFNTEWDKNDYGAVEIRKTAFHECCELLMSRMNALANYRHTTEDEVTEENHNIIRILEHILFHNNT